MALSQSAPYDLLLCGGGVIGLSIAWHTSQLGWRVAVADAQAIGQGASWAGAGILPSGALVPALDPLEQLRSLSHRIHAEWAPILREQTGIDNEFRRCGGLYLGRTQAERATLTANRMWWDEHGIPYDAWSPSRCVEQVPALKLLAVAEPALEATFLPNDCRLRNPRHLQALVAACRSQGVQFFEHQPVRSFVLNGDRVEGAQLDDEILRADRYCITSGAWGAELLQTLGNPSGILPVRGQMVLYRLPAPCFSMVINDGHRYLVPRDDGHVLAGSCEEEVGFRNETTQEMIDELRAWAESILLELKTASVVKAWAGLRPGSFDGYPYLGAIPSYRNAYVAAGHFRHGLHWSTGTAILMSQLMLGQRTEIDLKPFQIVRGQTSAQRNSPIAQHR